MPASRTKPEKPLPIRGGATAQAVEPALLPAVLPLGENGGERGTGEGAAAIAAPVLTPAEALLAAPLEGLPGLPERQAKLLTGLVGGDRLLDLLFHLPVDVLDRRPLGKPGDLPDGSLVTARVRVLSHKHIGFRGKTLSVQAVCEDEPLSIPLFNQASGWGAKRFPIDAELTISGRLKRNQYGMSVANPEYVAPPDIIPEFERRWPLTAKLAMPSVALAMRAALEVLHPFPEWQDPTLLQREKWPDFAEAIRQIQAPEGPPPPQAARERLAYDELFAGQLALALLRQQSREEPGRVLAGDGRLRRAALEAFGHQPTESQRLALAEIDADLEAPNRMLRLLQGDVGAGKTLVALMAMLRAVESGAQAAMMAPTELLARQHLRTLTRLCVPAGIQVAFLAGSVKGAERKQVLRGLASGSVQMVVGTHALFQEKVQFHDLGLAVVDEQHRFGVAQRLMLAGKGQDADLLVMTATPIPRTLLLTQWGEMAVSRLTGKPAGRQPITTTLHGLRQFPAVVGAIARALAGGQRVYWVCPHVAENEESDIAAAETRYATLVEEFGKAAVGLAHGQMSTEAREAALADFAAGRTRVLVATTVIEVGVDVPEATVMVVEHAERFGLAQLHQLRGRVGRGSGRSFCMLLYDENSGSTARERLSILRDTEDGFAIADADFRQRGGGEALGTRQAGNEVFRLALPVAEGQDRLLNIAHRDAALLLDRDPGLVSERGQAARILLRLFGKDAATERLRAG